jgi:hypothetical protein
MGKEEKSWTPEQIIQGFKELVTALLGLIIVGFTLKLAVKTFGYLGQTQILSEAKDILMLLLGLAGVVIGYYFGRVPADARASQAQEQANTASAHAEQISAEARSEAVQVEQVLNKISGGSSGERSFTEDFTASEINSELLRIRDRLWSLGTRK